MGSSAQNSSGVHWCRRRVRFNEVPEEVPKVPEKVWEALVQSQVRFNRVWEKVPKKVWCRARSGSTGFRRRFPRRFRRRSGAEPGQVRGSLGAKPSQVQQGSGEVSGEGRGGFGAEPGQVQQGAGKVAEKVWEALVQPGQVQRRFRRGSVRLWCRARSGSTGFWRRFRRRSEALVQSQVRFNRVPEQGSGEGSGEGRGGFGAKPGQVQQGSGTGSGEGSGRL